MLISRCWRLDGAICPGYDVTMALPRGKLTFDFRLAMVEFISGQHECNQAGGREYVYPKPRRIGDRRCLARIDVHGSFYFGHVDLDGNKKRPAELQSVFLIFVLSRLVGYFFGKNLPP